MEQAQAGAPAVKPLWKRILDFPLVALVVAIALFILANAIAFQVGKLLPPMDPNAGLAVRAVISIGIVWTVYKLAIRHLGDQPRDDLKLADAPKGLGIGLLFFNGRSAWGWVLTAAGAVIIVTGIVTNLDVYFRPTSLFNTLVMLTLLAAGIGLVARALRSH